MKVSELIAILQSLPQDVEVAGYEYDSEWSDGDYAPIARVEYKESVDVFDHHEDVDAHTVRSVFRKEPWVILFPEDDEEQKYQIVGRVYGRGVEK